jgi:hypothetical protein
MKIQWKKDKGKQGRKVIDIEIAYGEGIDKDRFCLYPVNNAINMWVLYDAVTGASHYILREAAEERIKEILKKGKPQSKNEPHTLNFFKLEKGRYKVSSNGVCIGRTSKRDRSWTARDLTGHERGSFTRRKDAAEYLLNKRY